MAERVMYRNVHNGIKPLINNRVPPLLEMVKNCYKSKDYLWSKRIGHVTIYVVKIISLHGTRFTTLLHHLSRHERATPNSSTRTSTMTTQHPKGAADGSASVTMALLDAVQKGNADAFTRVLNTSQEWLQPMVGTVYRFSHSLRLPLTHEELTHEAQIFLYESILRLRPEHSAYHAEGFIKKTVKFSLWRVVKTTYQEHIQQKTGDFLKRFLSPFKQVNTLDNLLKEQEAQAVRKCIKTYFTPDEQCYLERRYGLYEHQPQALREFADELGVTVQAVSGREKRMLKRLKHFLQKDSIFPQAE
jgi:hypothetical protein